MDPITSVQGSPRIEGGIIVMVGAGGQVREGRVTVGATSRCLIGSNGYGLMVVAVLKHPMAVGEYIVELIVSIDILEKNQRKSKGWDQK